jgi:hypothetical protein
MLSIGGWWVCSNMVRIKFILRLNTGPGVARALYYLGAPAGRSGAPS